LKSSSSANNFATRNAHDPRGRRISFRCEPDEFTAFSVSMVPANYDAAHARDHTGAHLGAARVAVTTWCGKRSEFARALDFFPPPPRFTAG